MSKPYPKDITEQVVQAIRDWADSIQETGVLEADGSGENEVIVRADGSIRPGPRIRRVFVFTMKDHEPVSTEQGETSNWKP